MKESIKKYMREIFEAIFIVVVLYFIMFPSKVDGNSMENTLKNGDVIFASRIMELAGMYGNEDIIIFKYNDGIKERRLIKRVAATNGDIVESIYGKLYINGEIKEKYNCEESFRYELGEGEYFVLGDNAQESIDSRVFGIIYKKDVEAKVIFKFLPINEFKLLF